MYKVSSNLKHFRFNSVWHKGPMHVMWYKLKEDANGYSQGVCFTYDEMNSVIAYMTQNPTNFDTVNYHQCSEEEAFPICDIYSIIPSHQRFPNNVILRKTPKIDTNSQIYPCMDIELLNANGSKNHNYNLSFDIIGVFQY